MEKTCCRCGETKSTSEFHARSIAQDGLNPACKDCLREDRRRRRALTDEDRAAERAAVVNRETKTCGRCGETKPRPEFGCRKRSHDGMTPWCRPCISDYSREHYEANREKRAAQRAAWYEANRTERIVQLRAWRLANLEREQARRIQREIEAPGAQAEYLRRWRDANRDRVRDYRYRREAKLRRVTVGPVDLEALWTGVCGICGASMDQAVLYPDPMSASVDHIVPLARGGTHEQGNLQWAHFVCNQKKGARMPEHQAAG